MAPTEKQQLRYLRRVSDVIAAFKPESDLVREYLVTLRDEVDVILDGYTGE